MAKIIIKRTKLFAGSAVKHDVYLDNEFLGLLKNGGVLNFDVPVGIHTLYFRTHGSSIMNKDAEFNLTVNDNDELIEISTEISFSGEYVVKYADDLPHVAKHIVIEKNGGLKCPACGSDDLTTISETYTVGKDFNRSNACCGYFLCGPLGLLLGVDKKGKQQHTNNFWVCKNCGNKFRM